MARRLVDSVAHPRRPVKPAGLTKRSFHDTTAHTPPYAGFIHKDASGVNHVWATGNAILYKATDAAGTTWGGTRLYNFNAWPTAAPFGATGIEGLFITSGGDIFVTAGAGNMLAVGVGKGAAAHNAAFAEDAFSYVLCNDTTTPFKPGATIGISGATTGFAPNQWSFWEIEHPWEAVGGLEIGDVIVGNYHRDTTDVVRAAFIWVMRKVDDVWYINAEPDFMEPADNEIINEPFVNWNTKFARVCKHIHHITMDQQGYLNFSTGDYRVTRAITSSAKATDSNLVVVTTTLDHQLSTGASVTIAGHTAGAGINGVKTVTVKNATTFSIDGSTYSQAGADGTFTPNVAATDEGDYYRLWRIKPSTTGSNPELLSAASHGYTSMTLLDDGYIVMGNDASTAGQFTEAGTGMVIDLWRYGKFIKTLYAAGRQNFDLPIFELVQAGGKIYAAVQRNLSGSLTAQQRAWSRGGILVADIPRNPEDIKFHVLIESGFPPVSGPGWFDADRIFAGRRRAVPGGTTKLVISVQPNNNLTGEIWTLDL